MLIDRQNLATAFRTFAASFNKAFAGAETQHKKLAMTVPSSTKQNDYTWLGNFPGMKEWLGDRDIAKLKAHVYSILNKKFEGTIAIQGDDLEDDNIGIYAPMTEELARSAKQHPDVLLAFLMAAGFTSLCYDGQYFFDTDHPAIVNDVATTFSNFGGGSGTAWYLLCTKRPVKAFIYQERRAPRFIALDDPKQNQSAFMRDEYLYGVDYRGNVGYGLWQLAYASKDTLNAANYAAARAAMMGYKKETGEPLGIKPDLLVVPSTLESAGRTLLKKQTLASGEDNEWFGTADLLVWEWL
jgi:phage major head subunit gpT-like protein